MQKMYMYTYMMNKNTAVLEKLMHKTERSILSCLSKIFFEIIAPLKTFVHQRKHSYLRLFFNWWIIDILYLLSFVLSAHYYLLGILFAPSNDE